MTDATEVQALPDSALELVRLIDSATAKLADTRLDILSAAELVETVTTLERAHRRADGVDARFYVEMSETDAFRIVGCTNESQFYDGHLRLGLGVGKRRRLVAESIGRMRSLQGELLEPKLPATAIEVSKGEIGADHVLRIKDTMKRIPAAVPADVQADAEAQLSGAARDLTPHSLTVLGNRLLDHLNPDGDLADDRDRSRNRSLTIGAQDQILMSRMFGWLTPQARAAFEAILALWGEPGMNNPDDPESPRGPAKAPGLDPAAVAAAADRDMRTRDQRNHDAFRALCEAHISDGALGAPTSLPAHLVITAALEDVENRSGVAHTATGTRLPVRDLVDLAAHATPWLEVFENHSSAVLYLGRGRRLASRDQRLAIFGRDRGCTAPGCTAPFSRTQAHHMPDWQDGCPTDIDHLGGACGGHNRKVENKPGGWETTVLPDGPHRGRIGWRPVGSDLPWQVNHLTHPEKIPKEPDDDSETDGDADDLGPPPAA